MQVLQIWKPQGQVQQNGCVFPQQLHVYDLDFRERFFTFAMFWLQKKVVFVGICLIYSSVTRGSGIS